MPLADQLRNLEKDRDALLDSIEALVVKAETEERGFTDEETKKHRGLKLQLEAIGGRHEAVWNALELQKQRAVRQGGTHPMDGLLGLSEHASVRDALVRSGLYGAIQRSGNLTGRGTLHIDARTLLTGTTAPGLVPKHDDLGAVQAQFGSVPLLGTVAFAVPINGGIITYSRIKISSGAAAKQSPEGAAKPRVVLAGDPIASPIATYAAFEKISTQALSDVGQVLAVIEAMLRGAVLDSISGDIYDLATTVGNSTPFVPTAGDVAQDSIIKAAAAIAATGAPRVAVAVNPSDFADMATAKAQGGGNYLGVSPMMAMPALVQSAAIPAGKLLASASDGSGLCFALRSELDVAIGLDADDFTRNLRTALAEARGLPFVRAPARVLAGDLTAGAGVTRSR